MEGEISAHRILTAGKCVAFAVLIDLSVELLRRGGMTRNSSTSERVGFE